MQTQFKDALKLVLPETVYIIGSAPSANEAVKLIPDDAYPLALNAAATVKGLRPCWHMASDWNTVNCKYWASGQLRKAERACGWKNIYSTDLIEYLEIAPPDVWPQNDIYIYRRGVGLHRQDVNLAPDELRPNATIAGEALQLCSKRGVRRVIIGGVDMRGNDYHDGTTGRHLADKTWHYVPLLNELVSHLRKLGMEIYTLTETALDLPYWRG